LPVRRELKQVGTPFPGVLYAGLMMDTTTHEIRVLEFNARFGDPETQVLLPRLQGDLYSWCEACAKGDLTALPDVVPFSEDFAVVVVGAASGYPDRPEKGQLISGPLGDGAVEDPDLQYFAAGLKASGNGHEPGRPGLVTGGGRVFGALGRGPSLDAAARKAYANLRRVEFRGMQFRTDIGR
ncbi:MAG TPA: phosphoribosylglycinamide synthetase C domain-containing protein, partial [Bdellovibrionota bacterium]|nr:phosphoribosylglycinamide synthetase C domain-containing protein [Bdellovibrionota bacterium]